MAANLIPMAGIGDPVSSLSHLLGAAVFAVLAVPLVRRARAVGQSDAGRTLSLAVFSASAVLLLAMSGTFHLLRAGPARGVFQRLDHAAIFVLIAGTFTPVHAILFRGGWRWGMLLFVWIAAAAGVSLKTIYFRSTPEGLGVGLYLAMGWLGLVSIVSVWKRFGARAALPLVAGGLAYTAGAVLELIDPPPLWPGVVRTHEVFHLAVLAGLALHWAFVYDIAGARAGSGRWKGAFAPVSRPTAGVLVSG